MHMFLLEVNLFFLRQIVDDGKLPSQTQIQMKWALSDLVRGWRSRNLQTFMWMCAVQWLWLLFIYKVDLPEDTGPHTEDILSHCQVLSLVDALLGGAG